MKKTVLYILFSLFTGNVMAQQATGPITLVIHGGAGTIEKSNMTEEMELAYRQKMEEALLAGYAVLASGGTSVTAIVETIKILEDSPLFNAGKGAVFNSSGKNELDASIMDGKTGKAGAVAGVSTIKNPITAALKVMDQSPHVMMSGSGAELFAKEMGIEIVDPSYFYTERRFNQLQQIIEKQKKSGESGEGNLKHITGEYKFGTVGALALDQYGNLAAGTSTGGMTYKKYGRIGDSPIIGAGTYASNDACAISATGHGEFFIRSVVAYDIAALMKYKGASLEEASEEVIQNKLVKIGGSGGVIGLDKGGNIAMPFNTSGMYRGYINEKDQPKTFIFKDE